MEPFVTFDELRSVFTSILLQRQAADATSKDAPLDRFGRKDKRSRRATNTSSIPGSTSVLTSNGTENARFKSSGLARPEVIRDKLAQQKRRATLNSGFFLVSPTASGPASTATSGSSSPIDAKQGSFLSCLVDNILSKSRAILEIRRRIGRLRDR